MGISNSKRKDDAKKRMAGETLEEKRRKALERYGILIPPAFGVTGTPSQKGIGPSMSVQHRLLSNYGNEPISYFQYLQETDLATILLNDHMRSGLWISSLAATNTKVQVSVTDSKNNDNNTSSLPSMPNAGRMFLEHKFTMNGKVKAIVQLKGDSGSSSVPLLSGSCVLWDTTSLFASVSPQGVGWLGGHWDKTFRRINNNNNNNPSTTTDDIYKYDPFQTAAHVKPYEGLDTMCRTTINTKIGAWVPISYDSNNIINNNNHSKVHGYAAVNALGGTCAIHGTFDYTKLNNSTYQTYFSINLNDIDKPPLQVTLEKLTNNNSAISLTQVIAFDRWQWNPIEDRAPKVRNTLAWTVKMESSLSSNNNNNNLIEDSGEHNTSQQQQQQEKSVGGGISMGAAWQINRAVAVKAVLKPNDASLTTAIIMKRWKHPRITCSVLNRIGNSNNNLNIQFIGLGIEVETGYFDDNPESYYYNHHPSPQTTTTILDNEQIPRTRVTLPENVSDKL